MQSYTHITHGEREKLWMWQKEGQSLRAMAAKLSRNVSSISRELRRNREEANHYDAFDGTCLYLQRRKRCRRKRRLEEDGDLLHFVRSSLAQYWSPEIIVARWKVDNPGSRLSANTIYSALQRNELADPTLKMNLRRYSSHPMPKGPNYATIHPDHTIHERPKEALERTRLGDWEGDTIRGLSGTGCLFTAVDRTSRYLCAALSNHMKAASILSAIETAMLGQPIHTITLDRGPEFSLFREMETRLHATVYFADAHAPWQRGSNENINGLLRFWFPKGTRFRDVSQEQLDEVLSFINNRPRKCLGWLSPIEFLSHCCT